MKQGQLRRDAVNRLMKAIASIDEVEAIMSDILSHQLSLASRRVALVDYAYPCI